MEKDYVQLLEDELLSLRMPEILKSQRNICAVVDARGDFKGLVYVEEIFSEMMKNPDKELLTAHHLVHTALKLVNINDDLKSVLGKMEEDRVWVLPVVDSDNNFKGFVSKTSIFNKYRALLMRQADYMS
ncbi:CBS domain-containing protein [Pedobacter kyonggii]|uniref:CBS domain-containing protein n=1 Tax=Pedobacter kyonggii TaxID=1926871 RepID=UPI001FC9C310|nr:CBS domain-containing protein [Pedobacter kyonggii]